MTKERLLELKAEIAKLKAQDDRSTARVAAEFDAMDKDLPMDNIDSAELKPFREIEIPCSAKLDYK